MQTPSAGPAAAGFYSSTAGLVLEDRQALSEHYKSDFHKYNLKRKVAGLPPVTKEWFEARKAQLLGAQGGGGAGLTTGGVPAGHVRVWFDPLTRKSFRSEATYQAHVRSNKYQEAVRRSGQAAPPAVVSIRKLHEPEEAVQGAPVTATGQQDAKPAGRQAGAGFTVVAPSGGLPLRAEEGGVTAAATEGVDGGDEDGWETASDEEELAAQLAAQQLDSPQGEGEQPWQEWDVRRSLFDNHMSSTFAANLEYMWRKYGFYLPDAQYLQDPEGLLKYLGAKLQYGRVPLYSRGDDANARQFRSLHAVQRHMVDAGRCKMLYEDNEDEYSEFYDYEDEGEPEEDADAGKQLALSGAGPAFTASGYELALPTASGQPKVLGTREFARYYRQKHRPMEERQLVMVNTMLAKYRSLGISLRDEADSLETKKLKSKSGHDHRWEGKRTQGLFMRNNINLNLPKNVPY